MNAGATPNEEVSTLSSIDLKVERGGKEVQQCKVEAGNSTKPARDFLDAPLVQCVAAF
jgi:hypothetical protein